MNKQFKIALLTVLGLALSSTYVNAQADAEVIQEVKKQQLAQLKKSNAHKKQLLEARKKERREKAVEKIKLRAQK
ncbi:hypothetical protein RS130_21025 [Paraglaciecola aquimarina]|uniref:Uncharacterized protein n=1 Tax=Paraglaciecola aquimarina TaxID=1235557 RepID=A0ABU3T189_9ALTE|nr:hypothetical protein [Paraglaciecola aquimarina]MDU0356041.1 hypothetical protein [Paraglaciecola aquimarina]